MLIMILSALIAEAVLDPVSVFLLADSALSAAPGFRYEFLFRGTGALANILPFVIGEASLLLDEDTSTPLMVLQFNELIEPGIIGELPVPSCYMALEDSAHRINHQTAVIHSGDIGTEAQRIFDFPPASVMMELVLPSPFAREIAADSIRVLPPDTVAGVPCHVFHVYYSNSSYEAVWSIGMSDFYPRAVERIGYYSENTLPGGQRLTLLGLGTDSLHQFVLAPPPNYTVVRGNPMLKPGEAAPEVFLSNVQGFTERIRFPGDKPFLLCFFSSWDGESLRILGLLNRIAGEVGELIEIRGISVWEENDPSFRLTNMETGFPLLIHGASSATEYGVTTVPSAFLVSRTGEILLSTEEPLSLTSDSLLELTGRNP